jgi:peptide/nickel transport system permease protein
MGLNQPMILRYLDWIGGLLRLDFGKSYTYSVPVIDLIAERLVVSLPLAVISLTLSTLIAIPVGLFAAARRGKAGDTAAMAVHRSASPCPISGSRCCLSTFSPSGCGWCPPAAFPAGGRHLAGAQGADPAGRRARPAAGGDPRPRHPLALIEVLGEDYIRTARAKGMPMRAVLWRHALRNAMIPVLTIIGLQFAFLLAGTIIIENVFYLPGLGRLVFQAITQRDLIVVESVVMLLVAPWSSST